MVTAAEISLSELIKSVAKELREARADTDDAVMQLEKCELELAVSVKGEAGGGIKFRILGAGAEVGTKISGETVSKIKVSFVPVEGKTAPVMHVAPQDRVGVEHGRRAKEG